MNEKFSKLRHEQKQEQTSAQQQQQQTQSMEFSSVEEALRYDAAQTAVPSGIAVKLNQSIAHEPKPAKPWWRRLFSK